MPGSSPKIVAASRIHVPMAVPPPASNSFTAPLAASRDCGEAAVGATARDAS